LGTTLRAIGLGRGIGTLLLVCSFSAANADTATAKVRPAANIAIRAVDRIGLNWARWVTAFLGRRIALRLWDTNNGSKTRMNYQLDEAFFCAATAAKSRPCRLRPMVNFRGEALPAALSPGDQTRYGFSGL
jgi:hypothetical protein